MKKILVSIAALCVGLSFNAAAQAANITLAWDANLAAENIIKYTVYQAVGPTGSFVKVSDTTSTTLLIPNLTPGLYRFQVTASNVWAESAPSNIVQTPVTPATAPKNLRIVIP
jgi:predicted phage tail protein